MEHSDNSEPDAVQMSVLWSELSDKPHDSEETTPTE